MCGFEAPCTGVHTGVKVYVWYCSTLYRGYILGYRCMSGFVAPCLGGKYRGYRCMCGIVAPCMPGTYRGARDDKCLPCSSFSYQARMGATSCVHCPWLGLTGVPAATSASACTCELFGTSETVKELCDLRVIDIVYIWGSSEGHQHSLYLRVINIAYIWGSSDGHQHSLYLRVINIAYIWGSSEGHQHSLYLRVIVKIACIWRS